MGFLVDWCLDSWDNMPGGKISRAVLSVVLLVLVISLPLGVYWSITPNSFEPVDEAKLDAETRGVKVTTGYSSVYTLHRVVDTLLHKPGGYITNDKLPPGLWLDNISNWEYGVLIQSRDLARAMRKDFSRSQSQSVEYPALTVTEPQLNFDSNSWLIPSTESQYKEGLEALVSYQLALANTEQSEAQFFARADNLNNWLGDVQTRLGSLSQRLSASVGQKRLNTDLAGDTAAEQSTQATNETEVKTPWLEIDDVFYEARGSAWALLHILKAIEHDFGPVLDKKNARVSLRQIIRELEATQETVWSPVILNGGGFGLFANHSLVMANYISRANASIIDLRELLANG
ncbi:MULTISPECIES: DUF2333 family protein [unclassified Neptuniibacter]|uniref:DUF2333 family protein n=1 Tax=unclassified Neptuniibacter TaxID=2630693 RepID=UPI000C460A1C|nr:MULTISPECIES: DUF2333 family protein [unclassified Neptuniibacter]MAY43372.1 hypothetical protein [Oceanospirillaceae bacterium]